MVALITNGLNRMRTLRSFSYTPRWIVFLIDVALAYKQPHDIRYWDDMF